MEKKLIAEGTSLKCYLLENKKQVYKELRDPSNDVAFFQKLSKEKCEDIAFPEELIYTNTGLLKGYIAPFFEGETIDYLQNETIENVLYATKELEKLIFSYANNDLFLYDISHLNVFYNKQEKRIKIVDIGLFVFSWDKVKWLHETLMCYNYTMVKAIFSNKSFDDENLKKYYYNCIVYGKVPFSFFLEKTIDYLESKENKKIITINELDEILTNKERKMK